MTTSDPVEPVERVRRAQAALQRHPRSQEPQGYVEPEWAQELAETAEQRSAEAWAEVMPSRFLWAKTTDFVRKVQGVLDDWAQHPKGRNLVVVGSLGAGKTHAAVAGARHGFEVMGQRTLFVPTVEMVEDLKPNGPPGYIRHLMTVDRLILDDLGAERRTDWTVEQLYAIVNRRWLDERPTVVTTNLNPRNGDLEESVRADTYSRLVGSGAVIVELTGKDRRRQ